MDKPKIILIGAGGHCRSCIDVIEQEGRFEIAGVVDNQPASVFGYPVLGSDDDLLELKDTYDYALVTVGQIESPAVRVRLVEKLIGLGFSLPVIVSPRAYVSEHAAVGVGTIVMHDSMINAGAKVGENCILNTGCLVEHDAIIGSFSHVSTQAV